MSKRDDDLRLRRVNTLVLTEEEFDRWLDKHYGPEASAEATYLFPAKAHEQRVARNAAKEAWRQVRMVAHERAMKL